MRKSTIFSKPYCLRGAWQSGRTDPAVPQHAGRHAGRQRRPVRCRDRHRQDLRLPGRRRPAGKYRAAGGRPQRPILISTSSIALQNATQKEYLPLLSGVLLSEGLISAPVEAIIRKGKAHYACDVRLERRIRQVEGSHKNPAARASPAHRPACAGFGPVVRDEQL